MCAASVVLHVPFQFTKLVFYENSMCNNCPTRRCRRIAGMLAGAQQRGQQQLCAAFLTGESSADFVCRRTVDDEGYRRKPL